MAVRRQVVQDFLRQANKIWLKREARKMRRIQDKYAEYISDLKRQISNLKPYHGVMAERQIRRLATQVKEERSKRFKGRPKKWSPDDEIGSDTDLNTSLVSRSGSAPQNRSMTSRHDASFRSTYAVSNNLHTKKNSSMLNRSINGSPGEMLEKSLLSVPEDASTSSKLIPSLEYMKGALWLSRNLVMLVENLVERIETFRTQYLREVTATAGDKDFERACQRLTLLAASRVGEVAAAAEEEKNKIKRLIHVNSFKLHSLI